MNSRAFLRRISRQFLQRPDSVTERKKRSILPGDSILPLSTPEQLLSTVYPLVLHSISPKNAEQRLTGKKERARVAEEEISSEIPVSSRIMSMARIIVPLIIGTTIPLSAHAWDPCRDFPGTFRPETSGTVSREANDLVLRFGFDAIVTICIGASSGPTDLAMGFPLFRRAGQAHIVIALDEHFLREFAGPIKAILAHEIAHSATPDGRRCPTMRYAEYLRCEADVDFAAALVVGKFAMLRAHQETRTYLATHKSAVEGVTDIIEEMSRRERMLSESFPHDE